MNHDDFEDEELQGMIDAYFSEDDDDDFDDELQQFLDDTSDNKGTEKIFKNATVKIDNAISCITVIKENGDRKFFFYKTEEEKEFLENRYSSIALFRLYSALFSVIVPVAFIGVYELMKADILHSFLQNPAIALLCIFLYLVFVGICYLFAPGIMALAVHLFHLEETVKEDKTLKFFLVAVVIFIIFLLFDFITQ